MSSYIRNPQGEIIKMYNVFDTEVRLTFKL